MEKKQLFALFACNLVGWIVAQGILGLLPVFAVRLGADPSWAGNILALSFVGLLAGTMATGWLSGRYQRRKLMLAAIGALSVPLTLLMGQAADQVQLAVLTAAVFFCIAVSFTTVNILAGLFAGEAERGKVFGLLGMNNALGALIGGALSGPIADRWGFPILFAVGASVWLLQPLIVLLVQDKRVAQSAPEMAGGQAAASLGVWFYLFILGSTMAFAATFFAVLGRPLVMDGLKFDASAISGAGALAGAIALPFSFTLGWLSDRFGRFWLIMLCYVIGAAGLVALAFSVELWHFRLASILLTSIGVSGGVGFAFMIDLVPPDKIGRALALFGFVGPVGGIIGFLVTGYAIQQFGAPQTFIGGALLTVAAIALIVSIRGRLRHRLAAATS
jgi:MFS transporter, DHA1 family, multidrug resistance protein